MNSKLPKFAMRASAAQRKLGLPAFLLAAVFVSGCDTMKTDNRRSNFPAPQIGVNNSIADVKIGEKVNGATCVTEVLGVFVFPLTKTSTTAVEESGLREAEKDAKEGAIWMQRRGQSLRRSLRVPLQDSTMTLSSTPSSP